MLAQAEKERKRAWWEGGRLVLEGYKQAAYRQLHSVSTFDFHYRYSPPSSLSLPLPSESCPISNSESRLGAED